MAKNTQTSFNVQSVASSLDGDDIDAISGEPRRSFLKAGLATGVVASSGLGAGLLCSEVKADDFSAFDIDPAVGTGFRVARAAQVKVDAAVQHFNETLALADQLDNNDEKRYASERFYSSFSKTLPCNGFGEVNSNAYRKFRRAVRKGRKADFDAIPLAPSATRRLENPQGSLRFEVSGIDSHATRIKPSFRFRSKVSAGQMGEVYWQALTRDVPFIEYDTNSLVASAVSDLNNFKRTPGPLDGARNLDTGRLFRGETPGDLAGPYISQYLLRPFSFGPTEFDQRYQVPTANVDFMIDKANWLNVQRGGTPAEAVTFDPARRYIFNNRALSEYVHRDLSFQAYQYAALVILGLPGGDAKFDSGNPYRNGSITNQTGFSSLGDPQILDMVTRVGVMALAGAWFQKFRVHRFLRPEAYGARVHFNMTGQRSYELNSDILNSDAVQQVFSKNGSYFCPQAFIEGSPTHPSYPAGHGAIAGACVTVLKAIFNEDFILDDNVQANADGSALIPYAGDVLTLGGELNKLANNISLGRDAAGVHYRQDGIEGMDAGEQIAIAYLQDQTRTYNESDFGGFTLSKFSGQKILILSGKVFSA